MACHGYLQLEGEIYLIEYIIRNCVYSVTGSEDPKLEFIPIPPPDVRVMCRNILNAFSSTIENMDQVRTHNEISVFVDSFDSRSYGH